MQNLRGPGTKTGGLKSRGAAVYRPRLLSESVNMGAHVLSLALIPGSRTSPRVMELEDPRGPPTLNPQPTTEVTEAPDTMTSLGWQLWHFLVTPPSGEQRMFQENPASFGTSPSIAAGLGKS